MPDDHARPALREDPRLPVDWRATIRCPDWASAEQLAATNVSRGGMFLRTDRRLSVGARVEVAVELPDGSRVPIQATVRHVNAAGSQAPEAEPGIGIEVDATYHNELAALAEIARLRQAPAPPASGPARRPLALDRSPTPPPRRAISLPAGAVGAIVGIDLGSALSAVAATAGETVYTVPDAHGRTQHPSMVCLGCCAERQSVVGWDAHRLQLDHPGRVIAGAKRLLGHPFADGALAAQLAALPYGCEPGPDGEAVLIIGEQGDAQGARRVSATEVCGLVLGHVQRSAAEQLGQPIRRAVLTFPVMASPAQREGLRHAAQRAELEAVALIPEPLAAALAHGFGRGASEVVGVYDFGGSFQFTVLELSATAYRVLGTATLPDVGGDQLDHALAAAVAETLRRRSGIELPASGLIWQKLLQTCERAKRRLSADEVTLIDVSSACPTAATDALSQQVQREAVERLFRPVLERTRAACAEGLRAASLLPSRLKAIVLAGGVTRLPFVQREVERIGPVAAAGGIQPEDAVVLGAATFAARLAGRPTSEVRSLKV
ncbi:MAG: Hsp70 family protein [Proteobacteria bacterium]|nr:Hsp70 family protein [Pseudomonadota bacterium]